MSTNHVLLIVDKMSTPYTDDDGNHHGEIPLYRATCSCGWKSPVFYAGIERVERSHARHLVDVSASETFGPKEVS